MKIVMVGTGYVGLVSGACFSEFGVDVACIDTDTAKIDALNAGQVPIYEPGLDDLVARNRAAGRLAFATDLAAAMVEADAVFIAVGTPSRRGDGHADLSFVYAAAEDIAKTITGRLVIVTKSTVPVGTGAEVERRIAAARADLRPGVDFDVVSNPEFLREGSAIEDFMRPDRVVVGAISDHAREVMRSLYRPLFLRETPILITSRETAELTKYAANAMLASRISFMNEIARLCENVGADVANVRRALGTDSRIGYPFLFPGVGYGGSCFPKDIRALLKTASHAGVKLELIEATERVNEAQKIYLVSKIRGHFGDGLKGKSLAIWGLAFKPRTDDMREAPALALIHALIEEGVSVRVYDPEAMDEARRHLASVEADVTYCAKSYEACDGADGLVLVTEWNEFREPDFDRIRDLLKDPVIFDGRNIYNPDKLKDLGFSYFGVGRR